MQILMLAILLATLPALAQKESAVPVPTGTVTGHVIFADTRQPARLVEVTLALRPDKADIEAEDSRLRTHEMSKSSVQRITSISTRTALDGSYSFSAVPAGVYYAFAKLGGYVLPVAPSTDPTKTSDFETLLRDIPQVVIRPNATSQIDIELHRGGSISGRVQFEDGSPVVEMIVGVDPVDSKEDILRSSPVSVRPFYLEQALATESQRILTDSGGHFSITGLRPGKYYVMTGLVTGGGERLSGNGTVSSSQHWKGDIVMIPVYAPACYHRSQGRVIEIKGSERVDDVQIEIRFDATHTVTGTLLSKVGARAPNDGQVLLKDEGDKLFMRQSEVNDDGSFALSEVPAGKYNLHLYSLALLADPEWLAHGCAPAPLTKFVERIVPIVVLDKDLSLPVILLDEEKEEQSEP